MATGKSYTRQDFVNLFNSIAKHKHRYAVFSDLVTMSAIALHNAVVFDEKLEDEYFQIIAQYSDAEVESLCNLFAIVVSLLDTEPKDILGTLYIELELGNNNNGQFFTPHEVSVLMAKINCGEAINTMIQSNNPFISLSEPACGAGGMVLAFASELQKHGRDPAQSLFAQCIDIDRIAGLMCYLQLSLWNIPAQVIIGDTLAMDWREIYYTPAYYVYKWDTRIKIRNLLDFIKSEHKADSSKKTIPIKTDTKIQSPSGKYQVDLFDFEIPH